MSKASFKRWVGSLDPEAQQLVRQVGDIRHQLFTHLRRLKAGHKAGALQSAQAIECSLDELKANLATYTADSYTAEPFSRKQRTASENEQTDGDNDREVSDGKGQPAPTQGP